jgi:glutamine---fructose-6-phosphate transaminase (isomerizing)
VILAGEERAVPATKTYTAQLAAIAVLALGLGAGLDISELRRAPDAVAEMLARQDDLEPLVSELATVPGVVVSGRGLAYSCALEIALKLKEACYLQAMGLSWADLLHGPIAVVGTRTPAILVAANPGPDAGRNHRVGAPGPGRRGPRLCDRRRAATRTRLQPGTCRR